MGVPKFFRWVTDRYPTILSAPLSATGNAISVDNLYLDMNGVIHECARAVADGAPDLMFDAMLQNIFHEICRIFDMVLPQRLLFIAVDGVAPRAKLNQQRARRFRSSKDRLKAMQDAGVESSFDSNCITPGTEFMTKLSVALKLFIEHMMKTDPRWRQLKIHFSGSEVPGEGEHKIISYIRDAKQQPDYQPNLRHCILGADADMIMLALATHEPYFLVLRDALLFGAGKRDNNKHNVRNGSRGPAVSAVGTAGTAAAPKPGKVMNYVRINVLRECLAAELLEDTDTEGSAYDIERVIDDFVFLTFLVGNDFLPSLPAINIGDDAFDLIFDAYKTVLASEPGYLVHDGELDVVRLETIFTFMGVTEKSMYYDQQLMQELKVKQAAERRAKYAHLRAQREGATAVGGESNTEAEAATVEQGEGRPVVPSLHVPIVLEGTASSQTTAANAAAVVDEPPTPTSQSSDGIHFVADAQDTQLSLPDREEACKNDYYRHKFGIDPTSAEGQAELREIVGAYLTGLRWCLRYYSTGCCSWGWYYPYHFGPFLQDMVGLQSVPSLSTVPLGQPLRPFQQLLACLPSASYSLLPSPYHALMCDPTSPLAHIYPEDFATDRNGKKQDYEAVVLLPFIDTAQLLAAEVQYCPESRLSAEEIARNQFGVSYVYTAQPTTSTSTSTSTTFVTATEIAMKVTPGVCFAAALVPGTVPPAISIPGFPSRAQLAEVVDYRKGYGKSKAAKNNQRTRANCYGENGGNGEGGADGAFPMPGLPVTTAVEQYVTSPPAAGAVKGALSPARQTPSSGSATAAAGATVGAGSKAGATLSAPADASLEVRLVVDARTSAFLYAVAQQVAAQSPLFQPDEELTPAAAYVRFPIGTLAGASVAQCRSLLTEGDVLSKAGAVFGTVTAALQPVGLLAMDGTVSIKFVDTSHLGQLEEFLCQRLLGNELLDSLCSLTPGGSSGSGGVNAAGIGFHRHINLGVYGGRDTDRFVAWLNKELYKLEKFLPVLSCGHLECVEEGPEDGDGLRVLRSVPLVG